MSLPKTGKISMSQVNIELGRPASTLISLNDSIVRALAGKPSGLISMLDLRGKANAYDYSITGDKQNFNLYDAIGIPVADVINVYIDSGVVISASTTKTPAFNIGNNYSGKTINIINSGTIRGQGGAGSSTGNGGAGGTAIFVRTDNKVHLTNNGAIYGGGGGGGKGGTGGTGKYSTSSKYTVREPSRGYYRRKKKPVHCVAYAVRKNNFWWAGKHIGKISGTTLTKGGWTYKRGPGKESAPYFVAYDIYRYQQRTKTTWHNTNGGKGGRGGKGWPLPQNGSGGLVGGKGAGKGGTGGKGGGAGLAGATGSKGANGNRGKGGAGGKGGRAGYAIDGISDVIIKTAGTIKGGQVN